jgi:hypothetical protein
MAATIAHHLVGSLSESHKQAARWDRHLVLLVSGIAAVLTLAFAISLDTPFFWFMAALCVAVVVLYEPRVGLHLIWLIAIVDVVSYDPLTAPFEWWLLWPVQGFFATPLEMLVVWTAIATIISCLARGEWHLPKPALVFSSAALSVLFVAQIFFGVNRGGNFTIALFETRWMFLVLPVMLITVALLTTKKHVYELAAVVGLALAYMTLELAWRYMFLLRGEPGETLETAFNHDGSAVVALAALIALAIALWSQEPRQRLGALLFSLVAVAVLLVTRRRAAIVCFEAGVLVLGLIIMMTSRKQLLMIAPVVIVAVALYTAAFWNHQGTLGQPARGFRTVFESSSKSERDQSSDGYRIAENMNLWIGIHANPIQGAGFGLAYAKPYPLPDLSKFWPTWDYIPHNNILWLWLKGGVLSFATFWFLVGSVFAESTRKARKTTSMFVRILMASVCTLATTLVLFAYVDVGLQSARLMTLFGGSLGLLSIAERLWPDEEQADVAT